MKRAFCWSLVADKLDEMMVVPVTNSGIGEGMVFLADSFSLFLGRSNGQ